MAGVEARRRALCAWVALVVTTMLSSDAHALEALDGKIQAHGFGEMQFRALSRSFEEEVDLAQWYNVINIELEFDIAPDGWGPFDLLSAYVRLEGRYDCIYSSGCGAFPSVRTWGDKSRALPLRLRDARDDAFAGSINANDFEVPSGRPFLHPDRNPFGWFVPVTTELPLQFAKPDGSPLESGKKGFYNPIIDDPALNASGLPCPVNNRPNTCPDNRPFETDTLDRRGFPGFDTLFRIQGADGEVGAFSDYNQPETPPSFFNQTTSPFTTGEIVLTD